MKNILLIILLTLIIQPSAKAGLFDWEYFEPTAGCVIGGALGYSAADEGEEMKQAAIYCAAAGAVGLLINYHYDTKYGEEFNEQEMFLENQIKKYNLLEQQKTQQKESMYFRRVREVIPPRVLPNGQGVGPRIKERLQLKDQGERIGM